MGHKAADYKFNGKGIKCGIVENRAHECPSRSSKNIWATQSTGAVAYVPPATEFPPMSVPVEATAPVAGVVLEEGAGPSHASGSSWEVPATLSTMETIAMEIASSNLNESNDNVINEWSEVINESNESTMNMESAKLVAIDNNKEGQSTNNLVNGNITVNLENNNGMDTESSQPIGEFSSQDSANGLEGAESPHILESPHLPLWEGWV